MFTNRHALLAFNYMYRGRLTLQPDVSKLPAGDQSHQHARDELSATFIPFSKGKTENQVVEILRGVAPELVLKRGIIAYEFPEWYTRLITVIAALAGVACWGLIALLGGFWGLALGWIAMVLVYKFLQAAGPILGLFGGGVAIAGLVIEALQKL